MKTYNKLMSYFWLIMAIGMTVYITVMVFVEGYKKWVPFYVFALIAFIMFFVKKWMMKRMEKHMEFLNNQNK